MDGQLPRLDELLTARMFDQAFGQLCAFPVSNHPPDHVAAENIQDDVEMIGGPLHRAAQLGDVPTPKLVSRSGQQLWLLIRRMSELIAAFPAFATPFQQAVHRANRAMEPPFIQQCGINLGGRAILKTLLMKTRQNSGLLGFGKGSARMPCSGCVLGVPVRKSKARALGHKASAGPG